MEQKPAPTEGYMLPSGLLNGQFGRQLVKSFLQPQVLLSSSGRTGTVCPLLQHQNTKMQLQCCSLVVCNIHRITPNSKKNPNSVGKYCQLCCGFFVNYFMPIKGEGIVFVGDGPSLENNVIVRSHRWRLGNNWQNCTATANAKHDLLMEGFDFQGHQPTSFYTPTEDEITLWPSILVSDRQA